MEKIEASSVRKRGMKLKLARDENKSSQRRRTNLNSEEVETSPKFKARMKMGLGDVGSKFKKRTNEVGTCKR